MVDNIKEFFSDLFEKKNDDDNDDKENKKRLTQFLAILGVIIVAGILIIMFVIPEDTNDTRDVKSDLKISDSDKAEVEATAQNIIERAGNFGFIPDKINADNLQEISYNLSVDENNSEEFFNSRQLSYDSIKRFIMPNSPIDYSDEVIARWNNDMELKSMISYEIDYVDTAAKDTAGRIDGNTAAVVDVDFTTKEQVRNKTANDTTWDGSYSIGQKMFNNNTAQFVFTKDPTSNEWRLYEIKDLKNKFLLSTWENPNIDSFLSTQQNFENVGVLERTVPYVSQEQPQQ